MKQLTKILDIIKEEYIDNLQKQTERKRSNRSKGVVSKYIKLEHRFNNKRIRTILFQSYDPNGSGKKWIQKIQIPELRDIIKQKNNQTLEEAIGMAVHAGNVNINCSCPDFRYQGYEWMADAGEYGITTQNIAPDKNNPELNGSVCKHINSVFESIDSNIPKITKDLRKYLEKRRNAS